VQRALQIPLLQGGIVFLPMALTFTIASRVSGARAKRRGTLVLIEGCLLQMVGLAAIALTVACVESPGALLLATVLTLFGFGQEMVLAPLSGVVLATVRPTSAGAGSGMYGTTAQIANAAGVAAIGAVFLALESTGSARHALFASFALFALSIVISVVFLTWMRRAVA
jgi:MFS family permease